MSVYFPKKLTMTYLILDISLLTGILITKGVFFVMSHFAILPY